MTWYLAVGKVHLLFTGIACSTLQRVQSEAHGSGNDFIPRWYLSQVGDNTHACFLHPQAVSWPRYCRPFQKNLGHGFLSKCVCFCFFLLWTAANRGIIKLFSYSLWGEDFFFFWGRGDYQSCKASWKAVVTFEHVSAHVSWNLKDRLAPSICRKMKWHYFRGVSISS